MVAREFLAAFREAQQAFRWEYREDGAIRGVAREGVRRATPAVPGPVDPAGAVLWAAVPGQISPIDRRRAAAELDLSPLDDEAIRDAADGIVWKWFGGEAVLDGYARWLRTEIALAAGLEPDDAETPVPPEPGSGGPAGSALEPDPELQHF